MKRIIFTAILIFAFCFTAYGNSPFDSYGKISWKNEMARLANLAIALTRDKDLKVVLQIRFDGNASKSKAKKRLNKIFLFLTDRKNWQIDKTRISFAISEEDEQRTVYWVMDSTVQFSYCDNCQIVKGENFEQGIKDLFPKK